MLRYNQKFVSVTAEKEMELLQKMREQQENNMKKARSKLYQNLYKKGLKSEMIKRLNHEDRRVKLTASEIVKAEKLAAALARYDEDDPRSLVFTDFDLRQDVRITDKKSVKSWKHGHDGADKKFKL
jgi:hypothetical protein